MYSDDELRAMYASGRGNRTARRFARGWAVVLGSGLAPRRWVTLEVPGRRSHRTTRFPLGMADWNGEWYLVSMLGENCNWVKNVRAADGHVVLRHGVRRRCRLVEIPPAERAPIIKAYVAKVPGGRPHIPVDRRAPIDEFVKIADRYPVFRVERETSRRSTRRSLRNLGRSYRSGTLAEWTPACSDPARTSGSGSPTREKPSGSCE
jgi:hypothetical protein